MARTILQPVSGERRMRFVPALHGLAGQFAGWLSCKRRGLVAFLVSFALAVLGAAAQDTPEYARHVVVVQFAPEVSIANKATASGLQEFDRRAARYGVHLIERVYPFLDHVEPTPKTRRNLLALRRTYYVRYSAGAAAEIVAADLATAPGVVYAEPALVNRTQALSQRLTPDDPSFGEQAELRLLRLPEAWDVVRGEEGAPRVVIAVVDGGGEWRHEDLRANVWTNPGEVAVNGIDDDDNGFVDDVHGVNFANGDATDNDPTGLPVTPGNARHGTASAGSASAVTDNGVGIAGAAWNAEVMHINASCGRASQDGIICSGYRGILYAAANGADIINTSWGSLRGTDDRIRLPDQTLELATDMGALVVASAGNNNYSNDLFRRYPARNPRVLSVGATEKASRRRARFSNYGKLVNVFAPGVAILTTGSDNGYVSISGTSFSSPLTAGVAALVKTRFPDMTPDALREHIRLTTDNMDAENPAMAGQLGRGFVNALEAVQPPSMPAVRLKRWSWVDRDRDRQIESGDAVTVTATVVNYLSDARQLTVGLVGAAPYPFIDMTAPEVDVGYLAGGDSVEVRFEFRVAFDAPANRHVRFYTHIRDGAFEDQADMLSFQVNRSLEVVHRSLSAFYVATGGDNWTQNDNWDITRVPTEKELDRWEGVSLSEGWLVALGLSENNLAGQIPPELGDLPQLRRLRLAGNSLTGPIPPELSHLTQLRDLSLNANSLTGPIPPEIGNLPMLRELVLDRNSLTGSILPEVGNLEPLQLLSLYDNTLTGPIPPEVGNLSQLRQLFLSRNSLSGRIPLEIGNLLQLQRLWLHNNSLTGPIPAELGGLLRLEELILGSNSLSGPVPPELGALSQLRNLNLGSNSFTGPIPSEFGNLQQLRWMDLEDNELTGMLPRSLLQLESLEALRFGGQGLCAPGDDEFQAWLSSIPSVDGPTCIRLELAGIVADQVFTSGAELQPFMLPEASGGLPPYTYTLEPALPAGLVFDSATRTVSGAPLEVASASSHTYSVMDIGGSSESLVFTIDVVEAVSFAVMVQDQSYPRTHPVVPLVLPEASGGAPPISYVLAPSLPAGLKYDAPTRTVSGSPTAVTAAPVPFTYKATGSNGSADSLLFSIEVFSPVDVERETVPASFASHGNYPNPFRRSTRLVFDLPWPASVTVEVMDITGRRVLTVPGESLAAGWGRSIELSGRTLSSGLYLYRLIAASPEGSSIHAGRFMRLR